MGDIKGTLRSEEAAKRLGVSRATIRRWILEGVLEGRKVGPRIFRISENSVRALEGDFSDETVA